MPPSLDPHSEDIRLADVSEDPLNFILKVISGTKKSFECCFDHTWQSVQSRNSTLWDLIVQLKLRGIRLRFITKITAENMYYCNKMMKYVELRHTDAVTGYLAISDTHEFFSYMPVIEEEKEEERHSKTQLIHIKNKSFVEMQRYLFDSLWIKSIPAREKVVEFMRHVISDDFTNSNIEDPYRTYEVALSIIKSAVDEILILFPTVNSFWYAENGEIISLLGEAVGRNVNVRILIQIQHDKNIREIIQRKLKERKQELQINTNYITKQLQKRSMIIVVDQTASLSIEIKDDMNDTLEGIFGIASCSKNEMTVSSYISIFESLWIQSEFEKQNKIKQAYFQIFKDFRLKDENYNRSWVFEQDKKKE
ncbi:MAG: hypothetical protein K0S91_69 [Nitrososphaeraceae archaeon]|nr:hypothetical protein [Nitrososphaeraceae archaeon]